MCQGFGGLNSAIDRGIGALNLNIAEQGAQSRLQAQGLASQQQACCCQVLRAIEQEACNHRGRIFLHKEGLMAYAGVTRWADIADEVETLRQYDLKR